MAALNKCNPAQLLILHIIKFLIYTLCFRGPTHNSLVLNSRGIKTTARWAPERCHLPELTVPAVGAEGRHERNAGMLVWAKAAAQGTRGYQVQGCMSCSQRCCRVKCSLQPSWSPQARGHSCILTPGTLTPGWWSGAPGLSGLLGRHLPMERFQTSSEKPETTQGYKLWSLWLVTGPFLHLWRGPRARNSAKGKVYALRAMGALPRLSSSAALALSFLFWFGLVLRVGWEGWGMGVKCKTMKAAASLLGNGQAGSPSVI